MNEEDAFITSEKEYFCRACLGTEYEMYAMSFEEINAYKTLISEVLHEESEMRICLICRHLLRKYIQFSQQCEKANNFIIKMHQQKTKLNKPQLSSHNYIITSPTFHHIYPEDIVSNTDTQKIEEADDSIFEYNNTDDDELPLVMLSKNGVLEENKPNRKRKKSRNDLTSQVSRTIQEIKSQDCIQNKYKKCKNIREGFSSRMVQETDEYLVIKLTKEQVLKEMQEKANGDNKYKRALFKCEKCVKGFNFEDVLRTHMEKHSKENGDFQCDLCFQYCPSAVSLRGHMKSHTTRYKCKLCGDVRLSRQHLLEHYAISHTSHATEYTCEHCYFTTNKRTVIQRHVRTHKQNERHTCHECGRLFQNIESLRVHSARHDKSKSLQCELCSRKFIYPSLLQKHVQSVHVDKDYYCVECDVRFKSPDNLRLHFKRARKHRDITAYTHQCPQCEERFISAPSLSVHLTTAHGEPKSYSCDVCRRLYSSRESLKGHMRRVHGERREAGQCCHICNKSFTRKSVLTVHMRTHTGERPHACACGAAFAQPASLRAHRATKHCDQS